MHGEKILGCRLVIRRDREPLLFASSSVFVFFRERLSTNVNSFERSSAHLLSIASSLFVLERNWVRCWSTFVRCRFLFAGVRTFAYRKPVLSFRQAIHTLFISLCPRWARPVIQLSKLDDDVCQVFSSSSSRTHRLNECNHPIALQMRDRANSLPWPYTNTSLRVTIVISSDAFWKKREGEEVQHLIWMI